jgi:aldehyde:ferredoxin oxidoreductase
VCKNARGSFYHEVEDVAKLYSYVTGFEVSAEQMAAAAERINILARLINVREGLTRKDDTLPWKVLNEPIPDEGPVKGAIVTEQELNLLIDDYYAVRGYSKQGVPTVEKLKALGMDDLVSIAQAKEAA